VVDIPLCVILFGIVRFFRIWVLTALATLAALAPAADATVFGIHEHLVVLDEPSSSVAPSADRSQTTDAHHCDLSVSPAADVWRPAVPRPEIVAVTSSAPLLFGPRHTPSVPIAPPRA
jgi:hypothetical protein